MSAEYQKMRVLLITDAYESGVGHAFDDLPNPHTPGSDCAIAYDMGKELGKRRGIGKPDNGVAIVPATTASVPDGWRLEAEKFGYSIYRPGKPDHGIRMDRNATHESSFIEGVFCQFLDGMLAAPPATAARVPEGWKIKQTGDWIKIVQPDRKGVKLRLNIGDHQDAAATLYRLAAAMLAAPASPAADERVRELEVIERRYKWLEEHHDTGLNGIELCKDEGDGYRPILRALSDFVDAALAARKADGPVQRLCGNCDSPMPKGCGGKFKNDGTACELNAPRKADGKGGGE